MQVLVIELLYRQEHSIKPSIQSLGMIRQFESSGDFAILANYSRVEAL